MPNLSSSTKHSQRRGGRWYENKKRGGVREGSLVGLGEKRVKIVDRQFKNQVVFKKNLKTKLFAKQFKHIYCKFLHVE